MNTNTTAGRNAALLSQELHAQHAQDVRAAMYLSADYKGLTLDEQMKRWSMYTYYFAFEKKLLEEFPPKKVETGPQKGNTGKATTSPMDHRQTLEDLLATRAETQCTAWVNEGLLANTSTIQVYNGRKRKLEKLVNFYLVAYRDREYQLRSSADGHLVGNIVPGRGKGNFRLE